VLLHSVTPAPQHRGPLLKRHLRPLPLGASRLSGRGDEVLDPRHPHPAQFCTGRRFDHSNVPAGPLPPTPDKNPPTPHLTVEHPASMGRELGPTGGHPPARAARG
jgi:hypothetical protein